MIDSNSNQIGNQVDVKQKQKLELNMEVNKKLDMPEWEARMEAPHIDNIFYFVTNKSGACS